MIAIIDLVYTLLYISFIITLGTVPILTTKTFFRYCFDNKKCYRIDEC